MFSDEIDMICFDQGCIANQKQLFLYVSESKYEHAVHEDQCANLHPFYFNRKYAKQAPALLEIKAEFEVQLSVVIDETVRRVADALKNKLAQQSSQLYEKELDQFRVENCGNMLQKIKRNRQASQEISFINSLFHEDSNGIRDHIVKKMKQCEEEIKNSLGRLDKQIVEQFQKIIHDFPFRQSKVIRQSPNKNLKVKFQEYSKNKPTRMIEEKIASQQLALREQMQLEFNNFEQLHNASNKYEAKIYPIANKTKQIQKATKTMKRLYNQPKEDSYYDSQESQESIKNQKQTNKDNKYIIRSQFDWINLLKNSIDCKKLVVYYPLAQEDLIKVINKSSPKEIYINYQVQLSQNFIENISTHVLQHLERLQEFWDQNEFFDQVLNNQYFPTDDSRHIKSIKKFHFSQKQFNLIPNLSNIWISSKKDLKSLNLSQLRLSQIDSLRIDACKCCSRLNQDTITQILETFKNSHTLKTLIIKSYILSSQNTQLLQQLTENNKNIECVILQFQAKMIPRKVLECFSQLPLKQLSISKKGNKEKEVVYMDITPITEIRTLRKLSMSNMFFTTQEVTHSDIKQGINFNLDEQVANKISMLTKLVFLDLFRCSPVYSSLVKKFNQRVKSQLYHLNLGFSYMTSSIAYQFFSLPQLKELNIDKTNVPLEQLLTEIAKKPLLSVKKLSLLNYNNGDSNKGNKSGNNKTRLKYSDLNDDDIDKISTCFPNLQYLNIAFCSNFTDLPEHKFEKLKYLCINKEYMTTAKIEWLKYQRGIEVYLYDGKKFDYFVK